MSQIQCINREFLFLPFLQRHDVLIVFISYQLLSSQTLIDLAVLSAAKSSSSSGTTPYTSQCQPPVSSRLVQPPISARHVSTKKNPGLAVCNWNRVSSLPDQSFSQKRYKSVWLGIFALISIRSCAIKPAG